jgi:hypothetical protein
MFELSLKQWPVYLSLHRAREELQKINDEVLQVYGDVYEKYGYSSKSAQLAYFRAEGQRQYIRALAYAIMDYEMILGLFPKSVCCKRSLS